MTRTADISWTTRALELYQERYVLLIQRSAHDSGPVEISWEEAAQYPLCLLHPGMAGTIKVE